jgi:hypothetical protein
MRDEREVFELLVAERVRVGEVAHVDAVGLEELVKRLARVHAGRYRPQLDRGEAMRKESLAA